MKKTLLITGLFALTFVLIECTTQKEVPIKYGFPSGIPDKDKADLMVYIDKGKNLFKENCAVCHGIFTKGKKKFPNFSKVKLDGYVAKFVQKDPGNHAVAQNMTLDDLRNVMVFLQYYQNPMPWDTTNAKPKTN